MLENSLKSLDLEWKRLFSSVRPPIFSSKKATLGSLCFSVADKGTACGASISSGCSTSDPKKWGTIQVFDSLSLSWLTWMKFLLLGFDLAHWWSQCSHLKVTQWSISLPYFLTPCYSLLYFDFRSKFKTGYCLWPPAFGFLRSFTLVIFECGVYWFVICLSKQTVKFVKADAYLIHTLVPST